MLHIVMVLKGMHCIANMSIKKTPQLYCNPFTEHKHLFVLGDGETQAQDWFMGTPLMAQYGPLWHGNNRPHQKRKKFRKLSPPGHIIVPPFNSQPEFQPSFVIQTLHEQQNQQKPFSLTSVAGTVNDRMEKRTGRIYRKYFHDELQQLTSISGMPFINSDHVTDIGANNLYEKYYPNSILCPVLPGDTWHVDAYHLLFLTQSYQIQRKE
jgi:hypothetical protein